MIFKGYKIRVRCIKWEQVDYLEKYWNYVAKFINKNNIIGLGTNWSKDYLYFDYALGVIDNEKNFQKLRNVDFKDTSFNAQYVEINLPDMHLWKTFKGQINDLREIYETKIDILGKEYNYELEYIDDKGNIEIKIHFLE